MILSMSGRYSTGKYFKTIVYSLTALFILLLSMLSYAHDYIPGAPQDVPILLKGGNLYTVSGPVRNATDLLFENGRITQIGKNLQVPDGAEVIDVSGQNVYPGLIAAYTSLGLTEIGAVRATNDATEVGSITPEVNTIIAYNPDSEIIPTVRSNGITTAQIVPGGSLLKGQSSIVNLDGWTREDAAVKMPDGMHLSWPQVRVSSSFWETRTMEEQKEQMAKNRKRLTQLFLDAHAYKKAKDADPTIKKDLRWEAMLPVLNKEIPLFISAGDYRQIEQAVHFAREQDIRIIITGGHDAWKLTDLLKENNIPVVLFGPQRTPAREGSDYDESYRAAYLLQQARVKFCLAQPGGFGSSPSWSVRNLPFQAGMSAAFGLTKSEALRAITLSVAEILGISKELGSLDEGKRANIIISDGDIMDHLTHSVTAMWIDGSTVDLDNKQKELFRKYSQKIYSR